MMTKKLRATIPLPALSPVTEFEFCQPFHQFFEVVPTAVSFFIRSGTVQRQTRDRIFFDVEFDIIAVRDDLSLF